LQFPSVFFTHHAGAFPGLGAPTWAALGVLHLASSFVTAWFQWEVPRALAAAAGVPVAADLRLGDVTALRTWRQMWARYHRSWHLFFSRHVYVPSGGGTRGVAVVVALSWVLHLGPALGSGLDKFRYHARTLALYWGVQGLALAGEVALARRGGGGPPTPTAEVANHALLLSFAAAVEVWCYGVLPVRAAAHAAWAGVAIAAAAGMGRAADRAVRSIHGKAV